MENDLIQRLTKVETILDTVIAELVEIKTNHLHELKEDIKRLGEKISGRPSWAVMLIISGLAAAVGILLPLVLQK